MSLQLEFTKHIHQRFKFIVSGFIRTIQSSLPHEENSFYIIPELIQMIILIFYYGEYFSIAGDYIDIDDSCIIPNSFFLVFNRIHTNADILLPRGKLYSNDDV